MIQVTLLAYFVLAALAALMLAFPDRRVWLTTAVGEVWAAFCTPFSRLRQLILNVLPRLAVQFGARMLPNIRIWFILHRRLVVLAFAVVFAPSLMVLVARGPVVFDFADYVGVRNRQIGLLLEGEHLVPPLPLPPEVFVTREVELVRPDIGRASRDWGMLDEEFTQRLLAVFRLMKERHGYEMVLLEGYRSPQRQAELLSRGRHVTQAGANMSYHQYGLAADAAFLRDGRIALSERDPWVMRGYDLFGELAEQAGLTWGGKWTLRDFGHVELRRPGVLGRDTRSNAAAG